MKFGLLIFIHTQFTTWTFSQVLNSVGLQFGVASANQTWNYNYPALEIERGYRTGFYGAATVDFLNSDHFHITSDLGYCEKGFSEKVEFQSGSSIIPVTLETQVSYVFLNNSIKLKYQAGNWLPFALLGFRVDRQFSYATYNDPKDFHEWIYGLTAALGIEYKIRRIGVFYEIQYLHDLTKFMDTEPTYDAGGNQLTTGLDITNRAYVMNLGLRYYVVKNHAVIGNEK